MPQAFLRPQLRLNPPLPFLDVVSNRFPLDPLWILIVIEIQPLDFLWTNDNDTEVLPGRGITEIVDLLPQLDIGIGWGFSNRMTWRWVFERTWNLQVRIEEILLSVVYSRQTK